jgi:hypothetical protein
MKKVFKSRMYSSDLPDYNNKRMQQIRKTMLCTSSSNIYVPPRIHMNVRTPTPN